MLKRKVLQQVKQQGHEVALKENNETLASLDSQNILQNSQKAEGYIGFKIEQYSKRTGITGFKKEKYLLIKYSGPQLNSNSPQGTPGKGFRITIVIVSLIPV